MIKFRTFKFFKFPDGLVKFGHRLIKMNYKALMAIKLNSKVSKKKKTKNKILTFKSSHNVLQRKRHSNWSELTYSPKFSLSNQTPFPSSHYKSKEPTLEKPCERERERDIQQHVHT